MAGLYFVLPTLIVVFVSFLIVRGASVMLMMTGLDQKKARFQALSAFTGTGFTTREAESVMNHPRRRTVVSWLMILGNAGIVTVIVTATTSLASSRGYQIPINFALIVLGIYFVYKLATRKGLMRGWERFIESRIARSASTEEMGAEDLLHLAEGYGLVRAFVEEDSNLAGRQLCESELGSRSVLVLGIERGRKWISVPDAREEICGGDRIVVYGLRGELDDLLRRR